MTIYTPYITRNGQRIYASQYGLKVFAIEVTEEQNKKYWERRAKKDKNKDTDTDTKK
ncbi:hypothetical protein NYE47_01020 [Paenibacillus sp. FSL H7-0941]|uniref:hypothetical protein n=1 Tax=Paenibacillus sp. FSL H7-0941 TaxID=2975351 RepID=UPI0030F8DF1A